MKIKIKIGILLIAFISGCATGPSTIHNADDFMVVDLSRVTDKRNKTIGELVDTMKTIRLQTTKKSLLSDFLKIEIGNKYIYVLDCSFHTIKIFTRSGIFHKEILKGRGPGEINDPTIIRYVEGEGKLYVYQDGLINCYSEDGTFVKDYQIPYWIDDFVKQGENFVCYQRAARTESRQARVIEVTPNMKVIYTFILEKEKLLFGVNNLSVNYKGDISFFRPFDKNIYTYKNRELLLSKQLDFDCPDYDWHSLESEFDYESFGNYAINHPEILTLSDFYAETADYEMYRIGKGSSFNYSTVFRNKKNGEIVDTYNSSISNPGIINNLIYAGAYNDYFVAYTPVSYIEHIRENGVENQISMYDAEIIKNIREEDNPLLVLIKMKTD